jgi:hypothetical protein
MDVWCVCVRAFFCICVQVEALRRADHPPNNSLLSASCTSGRVL